MATQKFTLKQTAQEVQAILDNNVGIEWEKEYETKDIFVPEALNLNDIQKEDERISNVWVTSTGDAWIEAGKRQKPTGEIVSDEKAQAPSSRWATWLPLEIPSTINKIYLGFVGEAFNNLTPTIYFYNEDKTFIDDVNAEKTDVNYDDLEYGYIVENIPQNAKYFAAYVNIFAVQDPKYKQSIIGIRTDKQALKGFTNEYLKLNSSNIGGLNSKKSLKNITFNPVFINENDYTEGSLNSSTGNEETGASKTRTDFIDIHNASNIYKYIFITNYREIYAKYPLVYCYNESKTFISMLTPKENNYDEVNMLYGTLLALPEGTRYIRCVGTTFTTYQTRLYLVRGDEAVEENQFDYKFIRKLQGSQIVCFGDSLFGSFEETADSNQSIPYRLGKILNATTYNVGFGGCNLVDRGDSTDWGYFSMTALTDAIVNNDFSDQEAAANRDVVSEYFKDHVATLKSIDFNNVNLCIINYGTNDFASKALENNEDPYDRTTIKGALRYCLKSLTNKFPNLYFAVDSLYKAFTVNLEEKTATEINSGKNGVTRIQFNQAIKEVCDEFGAIYIDCYNMGINEYNAPYKFFSWRDGTHPTQEGRVAVAYRIAETLNEKLYI